MLIVGRAVAGFGAAGILVGMINIISSCAPLEKRPALFGLAMGINQLGLVAGPLVGGVCNIFHLWPFNLNTRLRQSSLLGNELGANCA